MTTGEWARLQQGRELTLKGGVRATVTQVLPTKNGRGAWLLLSNGSRVYRENPDIKSGSKRV